VKQDKKISQLLKDANKLEKSIKELLREIEDYDLERLLKKIDAELMDVQHNLALAKRLAEGMPPKKKKSRK
jgi:cob(I)alamin adenosyltransferase